jgi:hypothetical protein
VDSCLHRHPRGLKASGISVFLLEELGDARVRCAQLKKYLDEATSLIDKSGARDHFFEVAGHLIHGIPDTLLRMDKALSAAALAASKLDYEEIKDELRPEKVEELEKALEEVRIRRVRRRSNHKLARSLSILGPRALSIFRSLFLPQLQGETVDALEQAVADTMVELARMRAGNRTRYSGKMESTKPDDLSMEEWVDLVEEEMGSWYADTKRGILKQATEKAMNTTEAAARLERLAAHVEATGQVDTGDLTDLISHLERGQPRTASEGSKEIAEVLRHLAAGLVDEPDPKDRPSRLTLASTLRRILGATMTVEAASLKDIKIRNRPHGSGVSLDDFTTAMEAAADNLYTCRGENRQAHTAIGDALTGYVARIGPLAGMPDAVITRAETLKKSTQDLDWAMGRVANDLEVLARDAKRVTPDMERIDRTAADASDDKKESRFEEGKPADPTKNMSPEEAKEWEANTDKYEDKFKAAGTKTSEDDTKESRFEEGKPADPTQNMSEADAEKWKTEHEKNKDKFKAAEANDPWKAN